MASRLQYWSLPLIRFHRSVLKGINYFAANKCSTVINYPSDVEKTDAGGWGRIFAAYVSSVFSSSCLALGSCRSTAGPLLGLPTRSGVVSLVCPPLSGLSRGLMN